LFKAVLQHNSHKPHKQRQKGCFFRHPIVRISIQYYWASAE
jgi:hypothetical protein